MKRYLTLVAVVFLAATVSLAQDEESDLNTLLGGIDSHGGYGAFSLGYASIDDKDGLVMGGRGAWIVNHSLGLGIGGKAFFNDYHYDSALDEDVNLQGGYGGLLIEPILGPMEKVHLSFPLLIGAGGIVHAEDYEHRRYDYNYRDDFINDSDAFFVIEPGAELEFNLIRFFRVAVGAYYLYTSNIELYDTSEDALRGFSYQLTFKFGKF